MAINLQKTNSLMFSRILKRNKTISQINVTPMVDVMLVLLVIFMITAPLLTVGVPINLPKTKNKFGDIDKSIRHLDSVNIPDLDVGFWKV